MYEKKYQETTGNLISGFVFPCSYQLNNNNGFVISTRILYVLQFLFLQYEYLEYKFKRTLNKHAKTLWRDKQKLFDIFLKCCPIYKNFYICVSRNKFK